MWIALGVIALVLGIVVSNIMLLKYTAKHPMKSFNPDPIEKARQRLEERQRLKENQRLDESKLEAGSDTQQDKKDP